MLTDVPSFIKYFDGIRRRTVAYIRTVPPAEVDWAPRPGEFTCAELIRHLAAGERMFAGLVVTGRWLYPGHTGPAGTPLDGLLAELDRAHTESTALLRTLPDTALGEPRPTLDGPEVKAWRLLLAMVEHEVHHRSQLAMYVTLLGGRPPHVFGLGVEDVIARATG